MPVDGGVSQDGLLYNPGLAQTSTYANARQVSTTPVLYRSSDPSVTSKVIALTAGGKLNAPTSAKVSEKKSVLDPRTSDPKSVAPIKTDLRNFAWNLPPHEWSRPIDPTQMDNIVADSSKFDGYSDPINRRGRIYYYLGIDSTQINTNNSNLEKNLNDRRYGLQFLWNPQQFSTAVSVNMDITPSAQDKFVKVVGAFPSSEVLAVEFKLDRTNDLYCLRSHKTAANSFNTNYDVFHQYYQGYSLDANNASTNRELFNKKLEALQTQGTLADIEYLYKAINGAGWKNVATGRESSDIGFLSPTLLKIEIGPVAYIGYVASLQVDHVRFTKGMIPMETDVLIQFNLMATAGLSGRQ